jgi:hypothetical protein
MKPPSTWLSETEVSYAKTIIVIGDVSDEVVSECMITYPLGFFLVSRKQYSSFSNKNFFQTNLYNDQKKFAESINKFLIIDPHNPPEVKVSTTVKEFETSLYQQLLQIVLTEIDTLLRARKTRKETGYTRQLQIFSNLDGYLLSRMPNDWQNLGTRKLAIVVGAGTSLDITLKHIKKGLPDPIIVATDSSLKALEKEGITPHFVVSIDPDKSLNSCTESSFTPGIAILSSQSHPSWAEKWNDKCYISGRVIAEDWLAERGVGKTSLLAINNAGLTAIAFANFINPAAILLIGMDLSGGGDGSIRYAKNTGRSHIEINASVFHDIPGNFEQTVRTPFFSDWKETSELCLTFSSTRTIINLNDRGALIEGCSLVHPDDTEEIKKLLRENIDCFDLREVNILKKRRAINGFGLVQVLTLLTTKCDQVWDALKKDDSEINPSAFFRTILSDKDIASLLGDFSFSIMPSLANLDNVESLQAEFDQIKNLLWKLEDGILNCNPPEEFIIRFLTEKFS